MPVIYSEADAVREIAEALIPSFHPDLATARIKYIYREKCSTKGGKPVYGRASKLSGVSEFLVGADFVIEVAFDLWNEMEGAQRQALVDHLLERCYGEEDEEDPSAAMSWKLREPDVHEFATILSRHGVWNEGLEGFVSAAKNVSSPDEEVVEVSAERSRQTE